MSISRRDALKGATAAAVVTGTLTAPLAIKAAGVKAALASASDARIFVLIEEHDRTFAEMRKANGCWCEAVWERMPPHLRYVSPFDRASGIPSGELWDAIKEAWDYPEVEARMAAKDRLEERCDELVDRLSQTEATTLEGVRAKMRFATRSGQGIDDDIVRSATADLERLAGEARS